MKYLSYLFLLITLFSTLSSSPYIDSLSLVIKQKISALEQSSYEIKNIDKIERKLAKTIKKQPTAQDVTSFLDYEHSIIFFFNDQITLKLNGDVSDEAMEVLQNFKDLKFAIAVKLYLYYLTCCKEKMLYKATKNYDALQFWKNELFAENLPFYNKNILRWISRSSYQERIERNIADLEKVSLETNSFLGMLCSNEDMLLQSQTEQDLKDNLKEVFGIQNELLHMTDDLSCDDMGLALATSLQQTVHFNEHLSKLYAQCQLPSHIARNWKAYTISTATLCACAYIYLHYGDALLQGLQHSYHEHAEKPVRQFVDQVMGYAKPPQLPLTSTVEDLIEYTVKLPPARGEDVPLHEALVKDCDIVSNGEFSAKFKQIDEKMAQVDDLIAKTQPVVDTIDGYHKRIEAFKKEHPNMLWGDIQKYFKAARDPVFPDVYKEGSRAIVSDIGRFIIGEDLTLPVSGQTVPNASSVVTDSLQDTFKEGSGEFGQVIQEGSSLDHEVAPDSSNWTFEQKKAYAEQQYATILKYFNKNMLRVSEPLTYKEVQGTIMMNKFAQDIHGLLGLAALIPMVTVIGGSLFASKNIYNSVAYQPIRKFVRELEVLLNDALYRQPSFDVQGKLYFLVEQLSLNVDILTLGEQKMMQDDLRSLRNYGLDYVQKYNVIQRMYKTYPCLAAGGA